MYGAQLYNYFSSVGLYMVKWQYAKFKCYTGTKYNMDNPFKGKPQVSTTVPLYKLLLIRTRAFYGIMKTKIASQKSS